MISINVLIGKTLSSVEVSDWEHEIIFTVNDGSKYRMYHKEDYSETVVIEDICGNLSDLIGFPILQAEESVNYQETPSTTWTFYKLATIKGSVTIRWYGESNGWYSEDVNFEKY